MGILDPKPLNKASGDAAYAPISGSANYAILWKPNTAYAAGQAVVSPYGDIATAKAAFTSGATYDATKWQATAQQVQNITQPLPAAQVTKGLYARTRPLGDGGTGSMRVFAKDPSTNGANGTGRLWAVGSRFAQIGYSDDDGATFVSKGSPAGIGSVPVQSMLFSANYLWLTTANDVWRLPKPAADGSITGTGVVAGSGWDSTVSAASNGAVLPQATINITNGNPFPSSGTITVYSSAGPQLITYTGKTLGTLTGCTGGTGTLSTGGTVTNAVRMFGLANLAAGPAGGTVAGGVNATFRNSCFAINAAETYAFICEYGTLNNTAQFPALTDGKMAKNGNLLFSANGTFTASHIGLAITVAGASGVGGDHATTITKIVRTSNPAVCEVSQPAGTAVDAATVTFPSTTYGAGVVMGGPSVYHCANPTAAAGSVSWSKVKTFPLAKHAHSVKIIGGLPWVGLGDMSEQFKDCGIWTASSVSTPTSWSQRSITANGSIPKDPINMIPATLSGQNVVLCESDSSFRDGPLLFSDQTGTAARMLESTCRIPQPYTQTMRQLTLLSNGNIMWFGTSEGGAVGPTSCIWLARAPYTVPVLLEDVGSAMDSETVGDGVVSNGYVWFGSYRCVQEKFTDQP